MQLNPDMHLGSYRLIERIGSGGMGEVWKGEDTRLRRIVAIKILPPAVVDNSESQARLLREARTAAQLYHPNIATIHAIEEFGNRSFIVMEYVRGEQLTRLMERGEINEATLCGIAHQIALAINEAHENGIVHRDIKPDNILVDGRKVKVLDFGIAKRIGFVPANTQTSGGFVTEAGTILGTVFYMSPEQALGKDLDGRTDIYSLGVVMYEAVTGRLPFAGETTTETLTRIIRDRPVPVRDVNPSVSPELAAIIDKTLQKQRDQRFATAAELAVSLDRCLSAVRFPSVPAPDEAPTVKGAAVTQEIAGGDRFASHATARRGFRGDEPTTENHAPRWRSGIISAVLLAALVGSVVLYNRSRQSTVETPARGPKKSRAKVAALAPAGRTVDPPDGAIDTFEGGSQEPTELSGANGGVVPPGGSSPEGARPLLDQQEASRAANGAVEGMDPMSSPRQFHEEGLRRLGSGNPRGAVQAFRAAVWKDPAFAPSRVKLGEMALFNREFVQAATQFRQALDHADLLTERERLSAELGLAIVLRDFERAEAVARDIEARYPGDEELKTFRDRASRAVSSEGEPRGGPRSPARNPRRRAP